MRSILIILLFGLGQHLFAQDSKTYTLYFDFNEYELSAQASQELRQLLTYVQELDEYTVQIEAHTDDKGAASYNRRLAERRAQTVRDFLEAEGLQVDKSDVFNFGEDRPAYDNEEEQGRQLNRRVDVTVTTIPLESLQDLMAKLSDGQQQRFTIDPNESTHLQAANGTTIWVPAGVFQLKDGTNPEGPVELVIEEHYSKSGMIVNELSTHSDGQMLETGGMIYMAAEANGEPLDFREGQALTLGMPTPTQLEGMQLFNAETNAGGRPVNWLPTGQGFAPSQQAALLIPTRPKRPIYIKWRMPYSRNLKTMPRKPAPIAVYPYQAPQLPKLENVQYNPPFFKRLFMGKKKIEARRIEMFEAQMARYEKNVKNYEKRMVAYRKAKKEQEQKMEAYRWAFETWEGKHIADSLELVGMHNKLEQQFSAQIAEQYEERLKQWKAIKDSILTAYYDAQQARGQLGMDGLSYYFYQVDKPGWINCDRFYDVPQEKQMALAVKDEDPEEEKVFVVFKEINSMMKLNFRQGNNYIQRNVPKDTPVKIIALKIADGQPSMAVLDTRIGEQPVVDLNYQKCRIKDVKAVLAEM